MSCFYITALIKDSGASEVSCVKTIWYLTVLNTTLQLFILLNRVGVLVALGYHEVDARTIFFVWHENKILCRIFLFIQIVKAISMAILFYKVVSLANSCKNIMQGYVMFWYAAEIQAILFVVIFTIVTVIALFFTCLLVTVRVLGDDFDVEDPEPVPINHGSNISPEGEIPKPKKPEVKKTEVELKSCSICLENEKTYACMPCGHMCLCALCAEDLSKKGVNDQNITRCPICRLKVDNIIRIFQ